MLVFGHVDLLGETERKTREALAKLLRVEIRHLARQRLALAVGEQIGSPLSSDHAPATIESFEFVKL
jgi:hypothetical protein